ncbi:MAG: hypothetical protein WD250_13265 [Egibacteraceae bacterium]
MPGRAQGVGATQRGEGAWRRLLVAVLAAACAFGVVLPEARAQEEERPGLGDLLAPLAPDDDDGPDAPPATTPPSAPATPGEPGEEAPPPEGAPPSEAAPAPPDVQGAQAAPRRPRSGSASGPGLQSGGPPPAGAGDAMPLEVAPPSVAPPEATVPQAAPPAGDGTGQDLAARPTASGAFSTEPAIPDLTVLALLALGLMWFDRRYRARYRLPPQ